ncbi:MAG TPA: prolyl oligopeptidase family serine peptidase [Vicinamibacterales bacterium]|jgi:dienelactone hydrolase
MFILRTFACVALAAFPVLAQPARPTPPTGALADYHVHVKGGLTLDDALSRSSQTGIRYGIVINGGLGFPVSSDEGLEAFLREMRGKPAFVAFQAEGREWVRLFSRRTLEKFDYVFTDAMTWTDDSGRRMRLWIEDEVGAIADPQAFMDMLVKRATGIFDNEPIDLYVNPTFLPKRIAAGYDSLWTPARMQRIVDRLAANGIGMEINNRYRIPSTAFIRLAKRSGVKFACGTNNTGPDDLGRNEYCAEMIRQCDLREADFWVPPADGRKAVQRRPFPRGGDGLTPARVDALRAEIRAHFFVPDPLPALDARTHRRFDPAPGVTAEAVSYATEFGTRVPAILYLPTPLPRGRIPAFIVVNGHGGDKHSWYSYYTGITFARGGAAVLTYDQAGEAERSAHRASGTRDHDRIEGDQVLARRLCGLMLTDVMQAVSYLSTRTEVDPARIGAGGYSLGSFVLALAGAVEPRLRACVMVGGGNLDGRGGYWDKSKPMCQGLPYQSLGFLGDRAAVIYALHAARGPALVWNGRADSVVNVPATLEPFFDDLRSRVVALRGTTDGVFEFGFVPDGSHRPYFLTRPVVLWLGLRLGFPNWTDASIRLMPETKIGAWVRATGVAVDMQYAADEREGGTLAVGDGVPGYRWEDLCVYTPTEWEQAKRPLVLDTWVEAARAAGTGR